jgi:hypothetical protein
MKGKCFAAITKLAPPDAYAYEKREGEEKDTYTRPRLHPPSLPRKVSSKKVPAAVPYHACNKICKLFF